MKRKKYLTRLVLAGGLTLSASSSVSAATHVTLTDINGSYAKTYIQALVDQGVISGYEDGTFRPFNRITREEFATLLVRTLNLTPDPAPAAKFTDVDYWARPYVGALVKAGLTAGVSSTTFGAHDPITREQLATFLVRGLGENESAQQMNIRPSFSDESQVESWAKAYVGLSQKIGLVSGITNGDGTFRFAPKEAADRQAVARLIYELYTNSQTYKSRVNQFVQTYEILNKSATAMNGLNSYKTVISIDAGPHQIKGTIDYTKNPTAMHASGSYSYHNESGTDVNLPVEIYVQNGTTYVRLSNGQWDAQPFESTDLPPITQEDVANVSVLTPYLTATDNGDSYVLTGTLNPSELDKLDANQNFPFSDLPSGESVQSVQCTISIAKNTHLINSIHIESTDKDKTKLDISFQDFNQVSPIQVPQDALKAGQK
jgi:hypothetical protein